MSPRLVGSAALLSMLVSGWPAHADEPAHAEDAAARAATVLTAVGLTEEAGDLFRAGKFAEALDRYQRADMVVHRHTIGLRIARCLEKLGRLSEAADRYGAVARAALPEDLEPDKLAKQKEAVAQAESEREALLPRIPGVVVQLTAPPGAEVTIDGQRVPEALFGVRRAIDPGAHHVEARLGAEVVTRDVTLKEGEVVTVPLTLQAPPPQEAARAPAPLPDTARGRRTLGYAGIGVGAAGVVVGIVTGALTLVNKSDLQQPSKCGTSLLCANTPDLTSEANAYNAERIASSAGLIVGGVLAAAGVTLVLTAPAVKATAPISLFVGPTGGGLRGRF